MARSKRQPATLRALPGIPGKRQISVNSSPVLLIVEDDAALRALMVAFFESEGYTTITASDGLEGLEVLNYVQPAVMLVDMMMPRMDGPAFVTAAAARSAISGTSIPVVMVSAAPRLREVAAALGVDYIYKPFDLDELLAMVQQHAPARLAGAPV